MNNLKYKNIVNSVFQGKKSKINYYLSNEYLNNIPTKPSNITFEFGEIYYYPIKNQLDLTQFNTSNDKNIEYQLIKQYIHQNRADAIAPENLLNIWIVDVNGTDKLGFSNFPWEIIDNYHGIIINKKCFFPEDYAETSFNLYKTFTHHVGHYLGLVHNCDDDFEINFRTNSKFDCTKDPTEKNNKIQTEETFNPMFMNQMSTTIDKYVAIFNKKQIQKMKYMVSIYRPNINTNIVQDKYKLPVPKYNPDTDTLIDMNNNIPVQKIITSQNVPLQTNLQNLQIQQSLQYPQSQIYQSYSPSQQSPQTQSYSQYQQPQQYPLNQTTIGSVIDINNSSQYNTGNQYYQQPNISSYGNTQNNTNYGYPTNSNNENIMSTPNLSYNNNNSQNSKIQKNN